MVLDRLTTGFCAIYKNHSTNALKILIYNVLILITRRWLNMILMIFISVIHEFCSLIDWKTGIKFGIPKRLKKKPENQLN